MSLKRELPDKQWTRSGYILMTKFHWTHRDLMELPLSTFMEINELMEWEAKETERRRK